MATAPTGPNSSPPASPAKISALPGERSPRPGERSLGGRGAGDEQEKEQHHHQEEEQHHQEENQEEEQHHQEQLNGLVGPAADDDDSHSHHGHNPRPSDGRNAEPRQHGGHSPYSNSSSGGGAGGGGGGAGGGGAGGHPPPLLNNTSMNGMPTITRTAAFPPSHPKTIGRPGPAGGEEQEEQEEEDEEEEEEDLDDLDLDLDLDVTCCGGGSGGGGGSSSGSSCASSSSCSSSQDPPVAELARLDLQEEDQDQQQQHHHHHHHHHQQQHGIAYVRYESELQMPWIMRLITKDLSEPYSIYTYRYFIHNWPQLCFLAMVEQECVGAIVCKLDMHKKMFRRGYIAMLAVDSKHRRKSIGTNLVKKAIYAMVEGDCDEVVLETEITNKSALKLYENLGFVRDKRLFRYYLNGVDALRLKLWLR
ncbi:unnamed protein product [Merluccius merluccius]